jgi:hypothetical protein
MRGTLISRLERLEATTARRTVVYRYGCLKALPNDVAGERHVVIVKRECSLRQVLLTMHAESISLRTIWRYDISEQKIAASRSDDRAAQSVGAKAGARRIQPICGGIYSCSPRIFGRTTGQGNDNLVPKRERDVASSQPDRGVLHSLPSPLPPPNGRGCRTRASELRRFEGASGRIPLKVIDSKIERPTIELGTQVRNAQYTKANSDARKVAIAERWDRDRPGYPRGAGACFRCRLALTGKLVSCLGGRPRVDPG